MSGTHQLRSRHEGMLGTVIDVHVLGLTVDAVESADEAILAEIDRLERVFNVFDPHSELRQWLRAEAGPGPELAGLLAEALDWQVRSEGAFNPSIGAIVELWKDGETRGQLPDPDALHQARDAIANAPFRFERGRLVTSGDLSHLNLNALAKGRIVDLATDVAFGLPGVEGVTINAGGDLLHRGAGSTVVGIEDPRRPYDNVPPLLRVEIANQALATSGGARRGYRIAGRRYSHVIDPRNGQPAEGVASASVIAADTTTADVVATILTVMDPDEGIRFVESLELVEGCLVDHTGRLWRSERWEAFESPS